MSIYEQAIEQIKKYKTCKQNCPTYILSSITGPTGPMGPQGVTGEPGPQGEQGLPGPIGPTGAQGIQGLQGPEGQPGPQGEQGEIGPTGPAGTSVTILGSYSTLGELQQKHPQGKPGDSYLIDTNLYVWSEENSKWVDVGVIKGPQGNPGERGLQGPKGDVGPIGPTGAQGIQGVKGPTGPTGATGPTGTSYTPTLFVITFNETVPPGGLKVDPDDRLPLETEIYDSDNLFYVSNVNNTITFMEKGIYKIDFTVQAHASEQINNQEAANIISVGFVKQEEPTVYAGNSVWGSKTTPTTISGHGIINLTYPKQLFELLNLGKYPIYLQSPKIDSLSTESSFASPIVTIMIQKIK